mmetsp:Transcript_707/g.1387  ORF Transcript_707/g.1387 Transcript_707/m.1387 type:complete len:85 (+) Transcript_707:1335-1589(+)
MSGGGGAEPTGEPVEMPTPPPTPCGLPLRSPASTPEDGMMLPPKEDDMVQDDPFTGAPLEVWDVPVCESIVRADGGGEGSVPPV